MVGVVKVAGFGAIAGMMLCGGFLAGQLESAARISSVRVPGTFPAEGFAVPSAHESPALRGNSSAAAQESQDFRPDELPEAILERLRAAIAMQQVRPVASLVASDGLEAHSSDAAEMHSATSEALQGLQKAFAGSRHKKLLQALQLLDVTNARLHQVELAALQPAAAHLSFQADAASSSPKAAGKSRKTVEVTVAKQPFGMTIMKGTVKVSDVFPGFPAQMVGVRKGCELKEIAGTPAAPGTWLDLFRQTPLPFKLSLECGGDGGGDGGGLGGAEVQDPRRYRVMVSRKPYGMNIQVNTVPRVTEVLPGYPAEAAGIRRGFVLIEVGDQPVSSDNWFNAYQASTVPFTLTFDTQVPLQLGNPYFQRGAERPMSLLNMSSFNITGDIGGTPPPLVQEEPLPGEGYEDVRVTVNTKPFGMRLESPPGMRPRVGTVMASSAAAAAGVREMDVLIEVAGRPVGSSTWFAAMQQARPPFGLLFRRQVVRPPPAE